MIQKHPQAMFVFESSRIHIAYNEGETFMPSKQYDSNQLFNMQFNDFMDLLNEAIEL